MASVTDFVFDPLDASVWDDPYPLYRQLRDARIYYNPERDFWAVSRYRDVRAALLDSAHFSSDHRTYRTLWGPRPARPGTLRESQLAMGRETSRASSMITLDPPDNKRLRDIASPAFGRRAMSVLEPTIREVCEELTEQLIAANETDDAELIRDVARPLPLTVTSAILGVPRSDWDHVIPLIEGAVNVIGGGLETAKELDPAALIHLHEYVGELFASKEAAGAAGDDLVAVHLGAVETGAMTRAEALAQLMLIAMAGVATTTHLIGNFFKAVLENPDQLAMLNDEPGLIESAVLETLRWEGPVQAVFRIVRADVEFLGARIPQGAYVLVFLAAGNRDERHYEDPDAFRVNRNPRDHLGFAPGVHNCLGGPLARLEARIVIETILRRVTRLEQRGPIAMLRNMALRGPEAVPIAFTVR